MILVEHNKKVPEEWHHDPYLKNENEQTIFEIYIK